MRGTRSFALGLGKRLAGCADRRVPRLGSGTIRHMGTMFLAALAAPAIADDAVLQNFEVTALDLCLPAALHNRSTRLDGLQALSRAEKMDLTGQDRFDMYFAPSGQRDVLLVDRGPANCEVIALGRHDALRGFPERHLITDTGLFQEYPDTPEQSRLFAGRGDTTILFVHDKDVTVFAARGGKRQ